MVQYKKLFNKSEIEYITPFLKLWMSFNNWYKQDLLSVLVKVIDQDGNVKKNIDGTDKEKKLTTDGEAINFYKTGGSVKTEFLRLLQGRSNADEKFQDALARFVKNVADCNYDGFEYPSDLFARNPSERAIHSKSLVFISAHTKEFYFTSGDENRLFETTLELIYQIRCKLVHGDFDIEDEIFLDFVEKSYRILYPIMEKIFETQANGEFYLKSITNNVEAQGVFNEGKMYVLAGSKVRKETVPSYSNANERNVILSEKAIEEKNCYMIKERIEFSSPSAASSFCLGNSSNGWEDWKTRSGKTMNDVLRQN